MIAAGSTTKIIVDDNLVNSITGVPIVGDGTMVIIIAAKDWQKVGVHLTQVSLDMSVKDTHHINIIKSIDGFNAIQRFYSIYLKLFIVMFLSTQKLKGCLYHFTMKTMI